MNRIVEKLWKSLRESLWGKCGKVFEELWKKEISTFFGDILHNFGIIGERFTGGFTHWFISVSGWFYTFSTNPTIATTKLLR